LKLLTKSQLPGLAPCIYLFIYLFETFATQFNVHRCKMSSTLKHIKQLNV